MKKKTKIMTNILFIKIIIDESNKHKCPANRKTMKLGFKVMQFYVFFLEKTVILRDFY